MPMGPIVRFWPLAALQKGDPAGKPRDGRRFSDCALLASLPSRWLLLRFRNRESSSEGPAYTRTGRAMKCNRKALEVYLKKNVVAN